MDAICTRQLTKCYGRHPALAELDLRVPAGSLFGFLGPNGAGKTTTLRILLGLLRATRGTATVLGRDAWHEGPALRAEIGYLPGDVRFYDDLTGRATLDFLLAARGGRGGAEALRLADAFDLALDRRVRNYSRGMKQKLGLIAALMHQPQLLILDEPTTALDPLVRETLYTELRAVVAAGRTVLFSSHTLAEVEALCSEVAILRAGRLVEHERIEVLRARALRHVELRMGKGALPEPLPAGLAVQTQQPGLLRGSWTGPPEDLVRWLARCHLTDVTIQPADLEDLFLTYYRDELHASADRAGDRRAGGAA